MEHTQRGYTLADLLAAFTVLACMLLVGTSAAARCRRQMALAAATSELRALFQRTRMAAIARNRNVALRFRRSGDTWSATPYEDGDGDGVRNDDIAAGIDRMLEPPHDVAFPPARIGTPSSPIPDPSSPGLLSARSPVRFGPRQLCSFSRRGEVTNGSIVLTNETSAAIVEIHGGSGQISVRRWNGAKWIDGD